MILLRPASTSKAQVPFFSLKKTDVWVYERYLWKMKKKKKKRNLGQGH